MTVRIIHGDCLDVLPRLAADGLRVHAVVTDPPYHLTSIVKRFGQEGAAPAKSAKTGVYARFATWETREAASSWRRLVATTRLLIRNLTFRSLNRSLRFAVTRLAKGQQIVQGIRFTVIGEKSERADVVHVRSRTTASLAQSAVTSLRCAFLRGPIWTSIPSGTTQILRMKRANSPLIPANTRTIFTAAFFYTRGPVRGQTPASNAGQLCKSLRGSAHPGILASRGAVFAPSMHRALPAALKVTATRLARRFDSGDGWDERRGLPDVSRVSARQRAITRCLPSMLGDTEALVAMMAGYADRHGSIVA